MRKFTPSQQEYETYLLNSMEIVFSKGTKIKTKDEIKQLLKPLSNAERRELFWKLANSKDYPESLTLDKVFVEQCIQKFYQTL
ncbi:hypothetical protein BBM40_19460 [Vibrio parahaemolyticus]|nr:hypothetical protein BBM40_19460 [Vibrio parahaemolyticus]